jgi:hypothetical protein
MGSVRKRIQTNPSSHLEKNNQSLDTRKSLGTTAQFWLNFQAAYDLRKAEIEKGEEILRDVHLLDCCVYG